MKLYHALAIGCMISNFLLGFEEKRATFDPSASLQNYSSLGRSLKELGISNTGFLSCTPVDILGWINVCSGWGPALGVAGCLATSLTSTYNIQ